MRIPFVAEWLECNEQKEFADTVEKLASLRLPKPDEHWKKEDIASLKEAIQKLVSLVKREIDIAPPSIKEILEDRELVKTGSTIPGILVLLEYY